MNSHVRLLVGPSFGWSLFPKKKLLLGLLFQSVSMNISTLNAPPHHVTGAANEDLPRQDLSLSLIF